MRIGSKGLELIKSFEGYHTRLPNGSCQAYLDKLVKPAYRSPGYNGLWTIGYGCTVGVTEGMVWSERQAEKMLMREIAKHEKALNDKITEQGIKLDQNHFDALVSASYNLGTGTMLIKRVLEYMAKDNEAAAARVFGLYNKAGGKVYKGLVRRRAAEAKLFVQYTPEDVVKGSRKLSFMSWLRKFIAGLGITTAMITQFMTDAREFLTDNAGIIALGLGVSMFVIMKWLETTSIEDYEDGRYKPSGLEE